MPKLFTGLPAEFEQYNPENLIAKTDLINKDKNGYATTCDNNGAYHSYNDLPSLIYKNKRQPVYVFQWHVHGVLSRSGNLPVAVEMSPSSYITYDFANHMHSYNGMPAGINFGLSETGGNTLLKWANHGKLEDSATGPAIIKTWNGFQRKYYHKNGQFHHIEQPAIVEENNKFWVFASALHNPNGPAKIERLEDSEPYSYNWFLYGIHLNEQVFNRIKIYQKYKNIPLWVAFLLGVELISSSTISHFTDEFGNWNATLPTNWLLQAFNITEQKWDVFAEKIYRADSSQNVFSYRQDNRLEFEPARFLDWLTIIEYEEKLTHQLKVN
jgi:hypothetical protein